MLPTEGMQLGNFKVVKVDYLGNNKGALKSSLMDNWTCVMQGVFCFRKHNILQLSNIFVFLLPFFLFFRKQRQWRHNSSEEEKAKAGRKKKNSCGTVSRVPKKT